VTLNGAMTIAACYLSDSWAFVTTY